MIELKTTTELAAMRAAGRVVARVLAEVRAHADVGVTLDELDALAREVIDAEGARPSFLGYHPSWAPGPYPAAVCTSVNDAMVHAIPDGRRLRPGDLLSVDCAARLDGWHGDAAVSFVVGPAERGDLALIDTTERALQAGIAAVRPGARLGDVCSAIGAVAEAAGTGCRTTWAGTVSAGECTSRRRYPTVAVPVEAWRYGPGWYSPSSRCCWQGAGGGLERDRTAGRCTPTTAPAPRTANTPWPSPSSARRS